MDGKSRISSVFFLSSFSSFLLKSSSAANLLHTTAIVVGGRSERNRGKKLSRGELLLGIEGPFFPSFSSSSSSVYKFLDIESPDAL